MKRFPSAVLNRLRGRASESPSKEAAGEVLLISFPKCGRTWLRVLLARLVANRAGVSDAESLQAAFNFSTLPKLLPGMPLIRTIHDDVPHWRRPEELETAKGRYRESRVIFLVRDPRDVVVSLYFELSKRLPSYLDIEREAVPVEIRSRVKPFKGTVDEFVSQGIGGFETIVAYFNIWAANRTVPRAFLLMRYEDLHADSTGQLRRLAEFLLTVSFSDSEIAEAVEFARFENMRRVEAAGTAGHFALTAPNPADADSFKTRRGVVGGFDDYLNREQATRLTEFMNAHLSPIFSY
jgi:hypothetical protein